MDGDRCRYCNTMDDRIHGIECPVMRAYEVLLLGLWTEELERLLSEYLGNAKSRGMDSPAHVADERNRIQRWRLDFHFKDPVAKRL